MVLHGLCQFWAWSLFFQGGQNGTPTSQCAYPFHFQGYTADSKSCSVRAAHRPTALIGVPQTVSMHELQYHAAQNCTFRPFQTLRDGFYRFRLKQQDIFTLVLSIQLLQELSTAASSISDLNWNRIGRFFRTKTVLPATRTCTQK